MCVVGFVYECANSTILSKLLDFFYVHLLNFNFFFFIWFYYFWIQNFYCDCSCDCSIQISRTTTTKSNDFFFIWYARHSTILCTMSLFAFHLFVFNGWYQPFIFTYFINMRADTNTYGPTQMCASAPAPALLLQGFV